VFVYLVTNTKNGKKYVGQTVRSLERRWIQHKSLSRNGQTYFSKAIKKHGPDSFAIAPLAQADTIEQLNLMEQLWIEELNTTDPKVGYNTTTGGGQARHTDASRRALSEARKGYKAPLESRIRMADAHKVSGASYDVSKMTELYRQGLSSKKISAFLGCSDATVVNYLNRSGLPLRSPGRPKVSVESIKQLRSIGFSYEQIASVVGCHSTTVQSKLSGWPDAR